MKNNILAKLLFHLAAFLLFCSFSVAEDFYVSNGRELRDALLGTQLNAEDDTIILAPGHYYHQGILRGRIYRYAFFSHGSNDSLTIMGAPGTKPQDVVLDAFEAGYVLSISDTGATARDPSKEINIIGLTLQNGRGEFEGGGLSIQSNLHNVSIRNCIIRNNRSVSGEGGGVRVRIMGDLVFEDNIIIDNQVSERMVRDRPDGELFARCVGGGAYLHAAGESKIIRNNLIARNRAAGHSECQGGGIWIEGGCYHTTDIINNTVYGNRASSYVGGLYVHTAFGTVNIYNNILYSNRYFGQHLHDLCPENWYSTDGVRVFNNNYASACAGLRRHSENININPLLVDAGEFGLRLSPDSPMINRGTTEVPASGLPASDFEGDPRSCGEGVDLGADEFCGVRRAAPLPSPATTIRRASGQIKTKPKEQGSLNTTPAYLSKPAK